jgi:methylenetetrahydrofolate reductase (NADPH)
MYAFDMYQYAQGEGRHCSSCTYHLPSTRAILTNRPSHSQEAKAHGCRNILALRGDPPAGKDEWEAIEGGFVHGIDLIRHIRRHYGDYFDIAIAGFPQQMLLPPEELEQEMIWLKEKIDVGCAFIFTQMFYDVEIFIKWVHCVREHGITIPIIPGIAPIQTWNGFMRATSLAKTIIPQSYMDVLEPVKNNDEQVRKLGTKLVAEMCRKILAEPLGIQGLHFYTMNLEKGTKMLLEELNLVPRVETIKPLPWRQVCHTCLVFFFFYEVQYTDYEYLLVAYSQSASRNYSSHFLGQQNQILLISY